MSSVEGAMESRLRGDSHARTQRLRVRQHAGAAPRHRALADAYL
eukprot:CAMPEP_0185156158 /NCGR_PEP_ID=MMETSP1139-20130426/915_1 /TAXON_ID=298111 /ORGANISM="Pavlova sp., Strain CCMP459" /LENGTH=43 /DNA_ID= /DNA_START= /DNA_END= /DNA_ORIENTATION=